MPCLRQSPRERLLREPCVHCQHHTGLVLDAIGTTATVTATTPTDGDALDTGGRPWASPWCPTVSCLAADGLALPPLPGGGAEGLDCRNVADGHVGVGDIRAVRLELFCLCNQLYADAAVRKVRDNLLLSHARTHARIRTPFYTHTHYANYSYSHAHE